MFKQQDGKQEGKRQIEIVVRKPKKWQKYDRHRMSPGRLVAWAEVRIKAGGGGC